MVAGFPGSIFFDQRWSPGNQGDRINEGKLAVRSKAQTLNALESSAVEFHQRLTLVAQKTPSRMIHAGTTPLVQKNQR
jgi:hypothetical protein